MKTILIVDDQEENLQTITQMLSQAPVEAPYRLLGAPNGLVALQVVEGMRPDLVITDWEMPLMNGLALLQALKAQPATRDIPVLMVTGVFLGAEGLNEALHTGAFDYLRKPVQMLELWARTASALRLKAQQEEIAAQYNIINAQKDRELGAKMLELQQKQNELSSLKESLEQLHPILEGRAQNLLGKVLRQLNGSTNPTEAWGAFKAQFEQVHPNFLSAVKARHPKLSTEDLKYCAYLRLNMGNQEIAQLLSIAHDSVRTHKYRLKKKLNLPQGQELAGYLLSLPG